MPGPTTDASREVMLRAALTRVDVRTLRQALAEASSPKFPVSKPIANALAALGKQRDPRSVLDRAQYRVALPYAAAVVAEPCLAAVISALGDDADDPTREQLLAAIDAVGPEFDDVMVAVMLASVADGDMAASELCLAVLDEDERFGLTDWRAGEVAASPSEPARSASPRPSAASSAEQREARRAKKQRDAEERRRETESKARAAARVREARKHERLEQAQSSRVPAPTAGPEERGATTAPSMGRRRAVLTPAEDEEFDRDDPWAAGVVHAWVPFDSADDDHPDMDGKVRPCVVIAGSPTEILVRAGYSQGGLRSRDWRATPVRHWRRSGFGEPTWIDVLAVSVARPEEGPVGWMEPDDWNALW